MIAVVVFKPGLHFMLIEHDQWCPGATGHASGCICNAITRIVTEDRFVETVAQTANRRQRRAAARRARRGKA